MPLYAAGYNNRSIAKREARDLTGALQDASKAIELDPKYAPAFFNRSAIAKLRGDVQSAQRDENAGRALTLSR
jgi:tetratricopeptide (TPR) repeat protein